MSNYLNLNQNLNCLSLDTGVITCGTLRYTNLTSGTLVTTRSTISNIRYTNVTTGTLVSTSATASNINSTNSTISTLSLTNSLNFIPSSTTYYCEIVKAVTTVDITDTTLCTITTASGEAGGYTLRIWGSVMHALSTVNTASGTRAFEVFYNRTMESSGTGVSGTLQYSSGSNATSSGARTVGTIVYSVVEVSEYVVDIVLNVNLTGSNPFTSSITTAHISFVSNGFVTRPVVS